MKNEKVVDAETKVVEEKIVEEKKGILTKLKNATIDKIPDKAKENIKKGAKALGIGVAGAALGALAYRKHTELVEYECVAVAYPGTDSDTDSDTTELVECDSVDNQIENAESVESTEED